MLQAKEYFPALTGLRAIAALFVFFNHQSWFSNWGVYANRLHYELHIGVSIFFVLSGFLITWHNLELKKNNTFNVKAYLLKRWARIYPLWLILTVITFFVQWCNCDYECFSYRYFLLNLTLTQAYFADALFTGVAQGWSLCVEIVFYILAVWLLFNRKHMFLIIPVMLGIGAMYIGIGKMFPQLELLYSVEHVLLYTFFGRALEFMAGAYLAELLFNREKYVTINSWPAYTMIGAIGIVLMPFILMYLTPTFPSSIYSIKGIVAQHTLMSVWVSLLLYGLTTEYSWLRTVLGSSLMEYAGKASFAFYLIHVGIFQTFISQHFLGWLEFPLLCLLSVLLYSLVENPLRKRVLSYKL